VTKVEVNEGNQGAVINLEEGDLLTVRLPANPSTGYAWSQRQSEGGVLGQLGEPNFVSGSQAGIVGAPGTMVWKFQASKVGSTQLSFNYARPWETNAPASVVNYSVLVRDNSSAMLSVTEADQGKSLFLRKGDVLVFNFGGNPSNGTVWSYVASPALQIREVASQRSPGVWEFEAEAVGEGTVTFSYGGVAPVKSYSWPVNISR
jgi:inhibitor of cysteine peptidase